MAGRRPNFVFVLTDDQGYGDLGCHGNDVIRTPNLDRFHRDAVRFTDFHVGTTCAPTRVRPADRPLLQQRRGLAHHRRALAAARGRVDPGRRPARGPATATGQFGKWHLGDSQPFRPSRPRLRTRRLPQRRRHRQHRRRLGQRLLRRHLLRQRRAAESSRATAPTCSSARACASSKSTATSRSTATSPPTPRTPAQCRAANTPPPTPTPHHTRTAPAFYGMITNIDENFGLLLQPPR